MDWMEIIVKLLVCILEVYLMYDFFDSVSNTREMLSKKGRIFISSIMVFLLFGLNIADNSYLNLIGFTILFWCFVVVVFDMKFRQRIFYFFIAYSINLVCELLYSIVVGMSTENVSEDGLPLLKDNILQLIAVKFLTYIVYIIMKRIITKKQKIMPDNLFFMYLCLPVAAFGMMITVFYSGVDFKSNPVQRILMIAFVMLMILGNILIFYAFNKYAEEIYENNRQNLIIMKQSDELEHIQELFRRNEKHQEFIHDTSNYLKTIKNMLLSGENEKVNKLLADLNKELEKSVVEEYSDNMILNTLLSEKVSTAESQNVSMDVYVEPYVRFGNIRDIDLISVIGNILDNAIRGAGECEISRKVKVRIFMQNEGNILVVKIKNDCAENIKLQENEDLKTTKKEKGIHGYGIKSVIRTTEKYGGQFEFFLEDNIFTAIAWFPIVENSI